MKLVTARQMQDLDRRTIDGGFVPSLTLMENAGRATSAQVMALLRRRGTPGGPVWIACGKGNNGGDGLVVARHLAQAGIPVTVALTHPPEDLSPDARANLERLPRTTFVHVVMLPEAIADPGTVDHDLDRGGDRRCRPAATAGSAEDDGSGEWRRALGQAAVCVDALLGTGVERVLRGRLAGLINIINREAAATVAVDVPSGVDASTGKVLGTAIWADVTVTFGLPKFGVAWHPGRARCGRVVVADIGFPADLVAEVDTPWSWFGHVEARACLPRLEADRHKYTRGKVLVLAGSRRYPGAAALAAGAALRAGAGMVHLAVPRSIAGMLDGMLPEVLVHGVEETSDGCVGEGASAGIGDLVAKVDALAVGPGLGREPATLDAVRRVLAGTANPAVVDADAIAAVGDAIDSPGPCVMTPHVGELAGWLGRDRAEVGADRVGAAAEAAVRGGAVVVAKGAPAVVVDGTRGIAATAPRSVNGSGNVGLATAGSGDVLTGMIATFLAQGATAWDAARLGTWLHGNVADRLRLEVAARSIRARDLIEALGPALLDLESSTPPAELP